MELLLRPKQFFNQHQSTKTVIGLVLLSLFVSTVFLTFFIIDLLVEEPLSAGKQLAKDCIYLFTDNPTLFHIEFSRYCRDFNLYVLFS